MGYGTAIKHNNMTIKKISYIALLALMFCGSYSSVDALTLYVEQPNGAVRVGDTVVLKVFLDTEDKEVNALEGTVSVSGDVKIDALHTGGSIFTLWPVAPLYTDQKISFVGGNQSSVFGGRLRVFTIAFTPQNTGTITFNTLQLVGYLADGKGTPLLSDSTQTTTFSVVEKAQNPRNDLKGMLEGDTTPPQAFTVEYSRDPFLYDGKVFLSFYATDNESGVEKYEVIEEGQIYEVSGGVYVLKNQNLTGDVTVVAIDAAGNRQSQSITFGAQESTLYKIVLVLGSLVLLGLVVWWFRKKRNEKI
jgi:hypothetical protein